MAEPLSQKLGAGNYIEIRAFTIVVVGLEVPMHDRFNPVA